MMSNNSDPDENEDNNKEIRESGQNTDATQNKNGLDKQRPRKKHFNVLHEDGSLADLPDREINGAGAESASITE